MSQTLKTSLPKAVKHILKPIVHILMRNEVSHAEFCELAKQAYFDVAHKYFAIPGKKMTHSRVAVLTGINRKEVLRLSRQKESQSETLEGTPNRARRVVNGWLNDPDFLDKDNKPLILNIKEGANSFYTLAARYSGDITAGAIIDELERLGIAERINSQQIKLNQEAYIPQSGELEKIDIISTCTTDLLDTAIYNLDVDAKEGRFQRELVYTDVPAEVAEEFQRLSSEKAQNLLVELNQWLAEKTRDDVSNDARNDAKQEESPAPEKKRVGLGIYYFENKANEQES